MTTSPLISEFDAQTGVATLTFNRPEVLNALSIPMAEAFLAAVKTLHSQSGLRCIVLTGSGRSFMAGGDVASMAGTKEQIRDFINGLLVPLNEAILLLRSIGAPMIAAVKGPAAGAGLSLALMADIVVAEDRAKFLIAYNGIGAVPDCGCTWFLPHKAGATRAAEMMILGRQLSAQEAKDWGLITSIAPSDSYDEILATTIKRVASGPTKAFGAFRQLVDQAAGRSLAQQLEAERQAFLKIAHTGDFEEGVSAFLAKRPAAFSGQ
ncbi:enoyl-CoA hydratase/isomerase family protein [Marinobacter salexigens]|uniref:Enoyl-CoA hydratase/isomerase family protein n=1 Tax=Marinobacter salexigens TaxID=1925763 RepID=A0ABS6A3C6_9GAMM|nr:enoyl-CoA hydratase-related protein [Marinobacter salexigens]MBU2872607.1 enoyl-CoA hydratase/isomerase family protein [Marinobacter salexigens]